MEDDLSQFTRMVLVSASNGFFETEEEHFLMSLKEEVQREFHYVNLNSNESIFCSRKICRLSWNRRENVSFLRTSLTVNVILQSVRKSKMEKSGRGI